MSQTKIYLWQLLSVFNVISPSQFLWIPSKTKLTDVREANLIEETKIVILASICDHILAEGIGYFLRLWFLSLRSIVRIVLLKKIN